MYGCELEEDGTTQGYFQYGYDGSEFLSLDKSTRTWTAANPQATITKHKWDGTGAEADFQKGYLENTCIEWLKKYLSYGKDSLLRRGRNIRCYDNILYMINTVTVIKKLLCWGVADINVNFIKVNCKKTLCLITFPSFIFL